MADIYGSLPAKGINLMEAIVSPLRSRRVLLLTFAGRVRRVTELLAPYAGFIHQTTLGDREHHDAPLIFGIRGGAGFDRYRRRLGTKREIALFEVTQSNLIFKDDQFGV